MRKIFVMSVLALAVTGCVNQQHSRPQVRDVSDAQQAVKNTPQYTVKTGDTLYGIAWEHNLDYRRLAALNNIAPPYNIFPGQAIRLRKGAQADGSRQVAQTQPDTSRGGAVATGLGQAGQASSAAGQSGAGVQPVDSQQVDWLLPDEPVATQDTSSATAKNDVAGNDADKDVVKKASNAGAGKPDAGTAEAEETQVVKATESASAAEKTPEKTKSVAKKTPDASSTREKRADRSYTPAKNIAWQWPVEGKLDGRFDEDGSITAGIDIAGEKGQSVKAAGPGIVVYAGSGVRGYGNLVLLKHNDQFLSAYAHNDSLSVSENDVVKAGEVIATMGNSDAESVKLHFEVRKDGEPQDPLTYLPSR